jgi:type I restriction enzyme M protein
VKTLVKINGRAAIVAPDSRALRGRCRQNGETKAARRSATFIRCRSLPTGVFYAQGVKANVLFFDRKPAQETSWTERLWIYDLRTNQHFALKTNPLKYVHLQDFIKCYNPQNRHQRVETERFRAFSYDELMKRDKVSLGIFWLKDESLEDSENLPTPEALAAEIVENLETALEQFRAIYEELGKDQAMESEIERGS